MEFAKHFLGTRGLGEYFAFILFTLIGMWFVKTVKYNIKKKKLLRQSPPKRINFNFGIWLDDNLLDFIIAFVCSFLTHRFFPDALHFITTILPIGEFEEKMFYGLLLGLGFQYVLHKLMNNYKISGSL